jgi:hypothetical protein
MRGQRGWVGIVAAGSLGVALMLQANSAVTTAQINTALQDSALPMGGAPNFDSGYGFIQADAALALLPPAASAPAINSSTSGGGGGLDEIALLGLVAALLLRRRRTACA